MKICIPTLDNKGLQSPISPHFGRALTFTIYETETKTIKIIPNTADHQEGACHPTDLFADKDIKIMLCQGIGYGALTKLNTLNITVFTGAKGQVQDALDAYHLNQLPIATDDTACQSHHKDNFNCTE